MFEVLTKLISGWGSYLFFNTKIWYWKWSRKWERVCCRNVHMLPSTRYYQNKRWWNPNSRDYLQQQRNAQWSNGAFLHLGGRTTATPTPPLTLLCVLTKFILEVDPRDYNIIWYLYKWICVVMKNKASSESCNNRSSINVLYYSRTSLDIYPVNIFFITTKNI